MTKIKSQEEKGIFQRSEGKNILQNITHFGIYQIISYLVPLITIPYILRVIGVEKFGVISFALALIYYFRIIVEYGFSITGVQMIAQNPSNPQKQSKIVCNVITIQLIISIICALVLTLLIIFIKRINFSKMVYIYTYGIVFGNIFLFLWFYIGSEKIKYLNVISSISKLIYIILILLLVKTEKDFIYIPMINSGTLLLAGIASMIILRYRFNIRFVRPDIRELIKYLKEGWYVFISNIGMNLYRNTNIIILGVLASDALVGIYSAGEKLIKAVQNMLSPITQTLYPYVSRMKVQNPKRLLYIFRYIIIIMSIIGGLLSLLTIGLAPTIARLIMGTTDKSLVLILRYASMVIMFGGINYVVGIIFMTNFNLKKEFSKSVIIVGVVNIIICFILTYFWKTVGTSISLTLSEMILLLLMTFYIYKLRNRWLILDKSI